MELPVNRIIQGNSLFVLEKLPDNSVDLVFTDPPYNISKELNIVMKNHPDNNEKKDRIISSDFGEWDHFDDEKQYIKFTEKWVSQCYRVLKDSGNFVSFFENFNLLLLKKIWEELGGRTRQPLYWIKKNPKPRLRKVDFMNAVESLFWGCKSESGHVFNYELGQKKNIVISAVFLNNERTGHPTQKPTPVVEPWVKYLSREGDVVLDPFAGSGTTCLLARKNNRKYIGIEIDPKYIDIAEKRIEKIPEKLDRWS
jgi:DNA modification methylase